MNTNYYECEFTNTESEGWGTYSICIKGERMPTPSEAEAFCSKDIQALGANKCLSVMPLTYEEAHDGSYDMDREDSFPIFR